jgi:hypothetical protein
VLGDATALDNRLRATVHSLLGTADRTRGASHGTVVAEAEDLVHSQRKIAGGTHDPGRA